MQAMIDIAKELDPDRTRTIGVVTKPDLIPARTHDRWLQLMANRRPGYELKLGYWVVMNPGQVGVRATRHLLSWMALPGWW